MPSSMICNSKNVHFSLACGFPYKYNEWYLPSILLLKRLYANVSFLYPDVGIL